MKAVCCANMPYVAEAFGTLGETVVLDGRQIVAASVREADLLALRSTTRVNETLLRGSRVRFVGTATIGTDHLDIPWLEEQGIVWSYAPGCNANSVSEYIVSALLCLAVRHGFTLRGKTLGVVGVGCVGSRVVEKARALGMRLLLNDPPRRRAGELCHRADGTPAQEWEFVALDRICRESDIVTFHVPLNREGADRSVHLADEAFFEKLKPGAMVVNAARGAVVDAAALMRAQERGTVRYVVLDTWENEPNFDLALLQRVDIGTPHIAGHSFEGKVAGTLMVYQAACRFLGVAPVWSPAALLPSPDVPEVAIDVAGRRDEEALHELTSRVYNVLDDDKNLRKALKDNLTIKIPELDKPPHALYFDRLRKNYAVRREFRFTRVHWTNASASLRRAARELGFAEGR